MEIKTKYNIGDKAWTQVVVYIPISQAPQKCPTCGHSPVYSPMTRSQKIAQGIIRRIEFRSKFIKEEEDASKISWERFVEKQYEDEREEDQDRIFYTIGTIEGGVVFRMINKLEKDLFDTEEEAKI